TRKANGGEDRQPRRRAPELCEHHASATSVSRARLAATPRVSSVQRLSTPSSGTRAIPGQTRRNQKTSTPRAVGARPTATAQTAAAQDRTIVPGQNRAAFTAFLQARGSGRSSRPP